MIRDSDCGRHDCTGTLASSLLVTFLITSALVTGTWSVTDRVYILDDSRGTGRTFDGVGAISGGGATSKLLVNYPEPQRSQVLDYLFKPSFGASLQILKVEIGGDSQSTDGSESSHMHTEDDQSYQRGYEWWLMKEAKRRNPAIRFYGLPWTFPGWVGSGIFNPFYNRTKPIKYILNWIEGAKKYHEIDISYIGIWNERTCDTTYIKLLRRELDNRGLHSVQIVAPDSMTWKTVESVQHDRDLAAALDILGVHYLTVSPATALTIDRPLWESEAYSAKNDIRGGACWARVLNEGYVRGFITGYIAWNLVASYYDGLPYSRSSIMTANEPWSGHYEVATPVWSSAHITQFVDVGWKYMKKEWGVGELTGNGTYIALTSPDSKHLTIVIQTMDPADVPCFYPMPKYTVLKKQIATFKLSGTHANIKALNVWYSTFNIKEYMEVTNKSETKCTGRPWKGWCDTSTAEVFIKKKPIKVVNGTFTLRLRKNEIYTLTTMNTGRKGSFKTSIPTSKPFTVPYQENFDGYQEEAEPYNFAQQSGSFEVHRSNDLSHGMVMVQMTTDPPVDTCLPERMPGATNLIGDSTWSDVVVQTDVFIERPPKGANSIFLGARVDIGGCWSMYANGFYLWLFPGSNNWTVSGNMTRSVVYDSKHYQIDYEKWYRIGLSIKEELSGDKEDASRTLVVSASIDNREVFSLMMDPTNATSKNGFIALGTGNYGRARFDNFNISEAKNNATRQSSQEDIDLERQLAELTRDTVNNESKTYSYGSTGSLSNTDKFLLKLNRKRPIM